MNLPGSMRYRLTLQSATVSRGSLGGETLTWTDSFTAFAAIEFKSTGSDERYSAKQLHNRTVMNVTIRKEDRNVSTKDRVVYGGLIYEIDAVIPTGERHEYLLLECLQTGEQKTI